jgi:molecular chaperone DnaK (HSP70)
MAAAVGIGLRTTNSVIAATEAGKPAVMPNAEGSRTTPSVVAFTPHDERLVGQLARIVDYLADEFRRDNGIDLRSDPQAVQRLFEAAEKARVEVSAVTQTMVSRPFFTPDASGPEHLSTTRMRPTSDQITADLIGRTTGPVKQALEDSKLTDSDIDEVILAGGSTRTPAVQSLVPRLTGGRNPA